MAHANDVRTDALQNGVARILMEAVMKLATLTDSRLFVLVENYEGGRQFAGSRHLTQAFRAGGIGPLPTDVEVQMPIEVPSGKPASIGAPAAHHHHHHGSSVRRPAPSRDHHHHHSSGVKRLKMSDGSEHVLEQQVAPPPAVSGALPIDSRYSTGAPAIVTSPYGQPPYVNNKSASDWSSGNLQTVQFDGVDGFQSPQHHHHPHHRDQHSDHHSLVDDSSDSCIPEELKKQWQEHRAALKDRSPKQLARLERERRKRENMSDAERELLRRKQAMQARERRRNQSCALSEARRNQDVEFEIEERARLVGARYDPPIEGETLQEQRNRRANNRRRVKFAENKLDAVGLGNFEVKPIDVHDSL